MTIPGLILVAGYALNIVLVMFILFFEENDSAHRFAWLLLVSFIPVAGIVLYVLFSGTFFTRSRRMLKATRQAYSYYEKILHDQQKNLDVLIQNNANSNLAEYGSLIHMNLKYGKSPVVMHNTVDLFRNGEEKFQALFNELRNAQDTIHLSYFIIKNDSSGKELMDILCEKSSEGITVRLLYDHIGSFFTSHTYFDPLKKAGGIVSRFFPVSLFNPFSINYRNHRKLVIIDGHIAYFGGMNIGDEYANRNNARPYYWRDTHVRVTGSVVQLIQQQFLVDWYTANSDDSDMENTLSPKRFFPTDTIEQTNRFHGYNKSWRIEDVPMQIVSSGPDDLRNDEIRDAMIHMITRAKKSVCIESPYFTPDQSFFTTLKLAAVSGVTVDIIIPGDWDKWYVRLAAMPFIRELLTYGVRFWKYNGFIHSKMLVIDGIIATIGSTNMDTRSFSLHFELNAFFYAQNFGEKCMEMFDEDLKNSRQITSADFAHTPLHRKALWNFFKLFSPLM